MYQMSVTLTKQTSGKSSTKAVVRRKSIPRKLKNAIGGVVAYCVRGPVGNVSFPSSKLVEMLRVGLPVRELNDLQATLGVPMEKLVPMLGISKATLHRRKTAGRLDQAESDRVVRFAKLMGKAVEVMESDENARQWLTSPQFGLG